jgi:hypothetical protein
VLFIVIQQEPCKPSLKELLASKSLINALKCENSFVKTAALQTNEKHAVKLTDWNLVEGELVRTQKQQFPAQKLSLIPCHKNSAQFHPQIASSLFKTEPQKGVCVWVLPRSLFLISLRMFARLAPVAKGIKRRARAALIKSRTR